VLYFSLVASGVLLLIVNLIAWKSPRPLAPMLAATALFFLASLLGMCGIALPTLVLQAVLLAALVVVWGARHWRRWLFFPLSCAATLLAYSVFGAIAFQETRQLQQDFPYVSMEDRLPLVKANRPMAPLSPTVSDQLDATENTLDEHSLNHLRAGWLRSIHEDAVRMFVNQPGFGVARMIRITPDLLKRRLRYEPPIPQPGTPSPSPWLMDSLTDNSAKDAYDLLSRHQGSVLDFVNADNFGYIKDRRHVAGFQEHQISQTPIPYKAWTLQTLDLIGIALHEEPVVYVSQYLPRMDELRAAPTRSLDDFEAAGLTALEKGDELFVRDRGEERRMIGAIRAAHQCLACHGCERGDLLGAFSYRLTQDRK
jgi:hypothetical protein